MAMNATLITYIISPGFINRSWAQLSVSPHLVMIMIILLFPNLHNTISQSRNGHRAPQGQPQLTVMPSCFSRSARRRFTTNTPSKCDLLTRRACLCVFTSARTRSHTPDAADSSALPPHQTRLPSY